MCLGRIAEEATLINISRESYKIACTTDHWTRTDNDTRTTRTGDCVNEDWSMRSHVLDFFVLEGSTTGAHIYADVKRVLGNYKGESPMTYDVIGITDTAGNMEVFVRHCQKNVEEHA